MHLVCVRRRQDVCIVKTVQKQFASRFLADGSCTRSPTLLHLSTLACRGMPTVAVAAAVKRSSTAQQTQPSVNTNDTCFKAFK